MRQIIKKLLIFSIGITLPLQVYYLFNRDYYSIQFLCSIIGFLLIAFFVNYAKYHSLLFLGFLSFYFLAELLVNIDFVSNINLLYVLNNLVFVFAYLSLFALLLVGLDFKEIWTKFKRFIVVLALSSIAIVYGMNEIIFDGEYVKVLSYNYATEFFYNIIVIALLCVSFLNFLDKDSKKSFLLFLICLCLSFSEVTQLAFIYIENYYTLFVILTLFKLAGFYFSFYYIMTTKDVKLNLIS